MSHGVSVKVMLMRSVSVASVMLIAARVVFVIVMFSKRLPVISEWLVLIA